MSKQNFYTLLKRYRNGDCTEREKRLVEQWFAMLDEEVPSRSPRENEELSERLWHVIQSRQANSLENTRPLPLAWKWVAASVLLLLAVSPAVYQKFRSKSPVAQEMAHNPVAAPPLLEKRNTTDQMMDLSLPDGSEVRLSPGSSMEYQPRFDQSQREVFLKGKALFKVIPDPEKPFFVHSGQITARVLGTSFWVDGGEDARIVEVSVISGKVSVSRNKAGEGQPELTEKNEIILTANQKAKFSNQSNLFETGLVEVPLKLVPDKKSGPDTEGFVFEDTPVAEVVRKLERAYGIEIILENDALERCLFQGDITEQPLFTKLDLLCASVNASYEIRGTRVFVSGKGCPL